MDRKGSALLEAVLAFALVGGFAAVLYQQFHITTERLAAETKRAQIIAESANLLERIGFDIDLVTGTQEGSFELVPGARWTLKVVQFDPTDTNQSRDNGADAQGLKHIELNAAWSHGTGSQRLSFSTLKRSAE